MAFSKAKLLRFNEIKSCVPAPGAYDPKYKTEVVGTVIPKCERFIDPKSPASSVCSDTQSACSIKSLPTFNTPNTPIPRRKKLFQQLTNKQMTNVKEKMTEHLNNDLKICELENYIEKLRLTINDLHEKIQETSSEKIKLIDQLNELMKQKENEVNKIRENYQNEIRDLNINFDNILLENKVSEEENLKTLKTLLLQQNIDNENKFKCDISHLEHLLTKTMEERDITIKSVEDKLNQTEGKCAELQLEIFNRTEELDNFKYQLNECKQQIDDLKFNHISEIKSLNELHKSEVQDLEYELLKSVTEWKKVVENTEKDFKKKILDIQKEKQVEIKRIEEHYKKISYANKQDTEAQIIQINENCTEKVKLVEIQMEEKLKELNQDWVLKLQQQERKADEILKECQSISEYSIIQSELEKKQLTSCLKQEKEILEAENITLQEIISKLKSDMSGIIIELNDTREKLGKEIKSHNYDIEQANIKQHSYKITLFKTHETMNALKNRLLDSDRDVEQLKAEIEILENNYIGQDGKISNLENNIDKLEIQKQSLELENATLKFEIEQKFKSTEKILLEKVDQMQNIAVENIDKVVKYYKTLEVEKEEAIEQLHENQEIIAQAQLLLRRVEIELDEVRNDNETLREQVKNQEMIILNHHDNKTNEMNLLNMKDNEIAKLKKLVQDQNALIGPFREQLELYEREKETLLTDKQSAEKEMKEMSLKYAEILGHQNKKQKIKYMVDLKKKNLELLESKQDCEAKMFKQSLLIDSLRHELKSLKTKTENRKKRRSRSLIVNKENVCSPVKSQVNNNTHKIDSPLKDRN